MFIIEKQIIKTNVVESNKSFPIKTFVDAIMFLDNVENYLLSGTIIKRTKTQLIINKDNSIVVLTIK